jgi:hypothetical protein
MNDNLPVYDIRYGVYNQQDELSLNERLIPSGTEHIAQDALLQKMCYYVLTYDDATGKVLSMEVDPIYSSKESK